MPDTYPWLRGTTQGTYAAYAQPADRRADDERDDDEHEVDEEEGRR